LTLHEKAIDTARQSRSTMNGTISQLHKRGSTNKTSDQRSVVLLSSGYQLLNYIISERLKRIVEQTNVLESRQGGCRQGRSVNINVQKKHFVCALLCFIKPILGNRYGPGVIPLQGTWGGQILMLQLNYVAGYTCPLLFFFERTQQLLR